MTDNHQFIKSNQLLTVNLMFMLLTLSVTIKIMFWEPF